MLSTISVLIITKRPAMPSLALFRERLSHNKLDIDLTFSPATSRVVMVMQCRIISLVTGLLKIQVNLMVWLEEDADPLLL